MKILRSVEYGVPSFQKIAVACVLLPAFLAGCFTQQRQATINDVAVPQSLDTGHRIVAVDGASATRARHSLHTVVPYVLVEPGDHTFTVANGGGERQEIAATVEADKRYRIARSADGSLRVVEDAPPHSP